MASANANLTLACFLLTFNTLPVRRMCPFKSTSNRTSKKCVTKRLNFNYLKLSALAVLMCTLSGSTQIAQVTDVTCVVATACAGVAMHGCQVTQFTVQTNGTYSLSASIDGCMGGGCTGCQAEAYIYKLDSQPVRIACVDSGCCGAQSTNVPLSQGNTYLLYACLLDCNGDNCDNCPGIYTARAIVS